MKKIKIAEGIECTQIALGESRRGDPTREAESFAVMDRYFALGGNTFDTARLYADGESDRALGKWVRARGHRDAVIVVSKGSHPSRDNMFISRLSKAEIAQDLDESLALMGLEYSDLHLVHRDDVKKPVEEIVPSLSALVKAGKTRAVGVSNWTVGRIIEANRFAAENGFAPLACCQLHFSLAQTTAHQVQDLTYVPMNDIEFTWYKESQLPVMAFGAQARGWFAVLAAGGTPKESPMRSYNILPENHRRLDRLQKLARTTGRSLAALATAYVRDSGLNAVVLSSFTRVAQLEEAFEATAFTLTPEQIKYLETGEGTC